MKLVKNINVDSDTVLTSSSIAEPDLLMGEAEWVDTTTLNTFGDYAGTYYAATLANDGSIYCVGSGGAVLKVDVVNQTTSTFGSYAGGYYAATLANDGDIYCVGDGGDVLKIDVANQTTSTFGSYTGIYRAVSLANDGNIYCVGDSGEVLKIDVANQATSTFGSYAGTYRAASLANDGNIYCVGNSGAALKIDVANQTTSTFGSYAGTYRAVSLANDGNIYCVGNSGAALKIDVANQTTSTFGSYAGGYYAATLASDGDIYCVGDGGDVLKIDVANQTTSTFGSYTGIYRAVSLANDGNIYCVGDSGEVLPIEKPYSAADQVIKTSTHKIYQALSLTRGDPEVGVTLSTPTWIEVSATNKYKAFDDVVGTQSASSTGEIVFNIEPGVNIDSVTGINITGATSVNVVMTDPLDGEVYNNTTQLLDASEINGAYSYWFGGVEYLPVFTMLDLPYYREAVTTITLTGSSELAIGGLIVGPSVSLGTTLYDTNTQLLDFSVYDEDDFGNIAVTKRPSANLVNFEVSVQSKDELDYVYKQLKSVVGEFALYIGEEEDAKEMTTAFGLHRNVTLTKESPTLNIYTLQVRSLI